MATAIPVAALAGVSLAALLALSALRPETATGGMVEVRPREIVTDDGAGRAPVEAPLGRLIPVEVMRVLDGDTLEVRAEIWLDQWIVTRVRLRDIDAPELAAHCPAEAARADAARQRLADLLAAGRVFLADLGRDKYGGRVLGRLVTADGRDLGRRLIAEGHARPYAGRRREPWC